MTRISFGFVAALAALGLSTACNKPTDDSCRKAISNMRTLLGTASPTANDDIEGDVRRCKGGSTKKAVECAGKATTIDELRACDFMKVPAKAGATSGTGAPAAGSAATGTTGAGAAGAGTDTAGSAAGSATK